ncbi:hypothetical protein B0H16DRAFT_556696 [Mycena metata]|uniref:Uncharacterized protein n=1 Tax=Mycena metata TaxID=1033252 RepID=A0AAD7JD29_9AGAR|nr:hypothetical protein B0H16DRAFT_556696 [Mycena metata]
MANADLSCLQCWPSKTRRMTQDLKLVHKLVPKGFGKLALSTWQTRQNSRTEPSLTLFSVIGAFKKQDKFGTKVLNFGPAAASSCEQILDWYKTRTWTCSTYIQCDDSTVARPQGRRYIQVTLSILQAALPLGVLAVWIQPGVALMAGRVFSCKEMESDACFEAIGLAASLVLVRCLLGINLFFALYDNETSSNYCVKRWNPRRLPNAGWIRYDQEYYCFLVALSGRFTPFNFAELVVVQGLHAPAGTSERFKNQQNGLEFKRFKK